MGMQNEVMPLVGGIHTAPDVVRVALNGLNRLPNHCRDILPPDKNDQCGTPGYLKAIPLAEQRYERYLKERTQEEEQR